MDSKVVNKELRDVVRPVLKEAGFTKFTGRKAWRFFEGAKWVVNFQSFSAYLAEGVGCTTYSFSLRLGIYLDIVPPWPESDVIATPKEWECAFRFTGLKGLSQPMFHPYGRQQAVDCSDVWFVREDGSNLVEVAEDARFVIEGPGLMTLQSYQDPLYAYCALFDYARHWPPIPPAPQIEVTPSGAYESPRWLEVVTALGTQLGRDVDADLLVGVPAPLMQNVLGR